MDYWFVPIIIGEREEECGSVGAQFHTKLSQYGSWIVKQGTAEDALTITSLRAFILILKRHTRKKKINSRNYHKN